jgi:hypothetical protein
VGTTGRQLEVPSSTRRFISFALKCKRIQIGRHADEVDACSAPEFLEHSGQRRANSNYCRSILWDRGSARAGVAEGRLEPWTLVAAQGEALGHCDGASFDFTKSLRRSAVFTS